MTAEIPERQSTPDPRGASIITGGRLLRYLVAPALIFVFLLPHGREAGGDLSALLRGTDDFMRLVQVIDWLDGQGWSDMVQRRLNPPAGVSMHWSRFADLPAAAGIWLAEPWFGRDRAVYLSALLVPPLLGGLFAAIFLWAAAVLTPDSRAHVHFLMMGTALFPLTAFRAGRIDHHGLQLVLTALAVGLLVRTLDSSRSRSAVGLGVAGGTSLAIGLETLPFLGAAAVILGLVWALRGGHAAASLALIGAAATGTVLALLPLTLPRSEWTVVVCDRMSLAHVAMTAVILAAGGGAFALERLRPTAARTARLATVGGVAVAALALAAAAFPACAGSPYANVSVEVRYWLDRVREAQSLLEYFRSKPGFTVSIAILPLAALVVLGFQRMRSRGEADPRWIALVVLVLSSVAVLLWQIRGAAHAGLVAGLALMPLAAAMDARADRMKPILIRVGLRLCVPVTCMVMILLPLRVMPPASSAAQEEQESGCEVRSVLAALTDPAGLGAEARIIAAPIDLGPEVLLLTRHKVLAAPYHRNTQGLADSRRIFAGTEEEALAMVRARAVDAVLFCEEYAWVSAYEDRSAFLDERLGEGRPPWWLIPVSHHEDISLYRVHSAATGE